MRAVSLFVFVIALVLSVSQLALAESTGVSGFYNFTLVVDRTGPNVTLTANKYDFSLEQGYNPTYHKNMQFLREIVTPVGIQQKYHCMGGECFLNISAEDKLPIKSIEITSDYGEVTPLLINGTWFINSVCTKQDTTRGSTYQQIYGCPEHSGPKAVEIMNNLSSDQLEKMIDENGKIHKQKKVNERWLHKSMIDYFSLSDLSKYKPHNNDYYEILNITTEDLLGNKKTKNIRIIPVDYQIRLITKTSYTEQEKCKRDYVGPYLFTENHGGIRRIEVQPNHHVKQTISISFWSMLYGNDQSCETKKSLKDDFSNVILDQCDWPGIFFNEHLSSKLPNDWNNKNLEIIFHITERAIHPTPRLVYVPDVGSILSTVGWNGVIGILALANVKTDYGDQDSYSTNLELTTQNEPSYGSCTGDYPVTRWGENWELEKDSSGTGITLTSQDLEWHDGDYPNYFRTDTVSECSSSSNVNINLEMSRSGSIVTATASNIPEDYTHVLFAWKLTNQTGNILNEWLNNNIPVKNSEAKDTLSIPSDLPADNYILEATVSAGLGGNNWYTSKEYCFTVNNEGEISDRECE